MYSNLTGFISKKEMYDERVESKFDDWEDEREYIHKCITYNQDKYFKIIADTIKDGDLIYDGLVLIVCDAFNLTINYGKPSVAYAIVNYYLDNDIMIDFKQWLYSDNGPIVKNEFDIKKVFPELKHIKSLETLITIANKIYNLNLKLAGDNTVYAMTFNYDFDRIDVKLLQEIKEEQEFCNKYNIELCQESQEKLKTFNLNNETLTKLMEVI